VSSYNAKSGTPVQRIGVPFCKVVCQCGIRQWPKWCIGSAVTLTHLADQKGTDVQVLYDEHVCMSVRSVALTILQSPAYRSSDSGRLLYFGNVLSFSPPQIFRRPWADFRETLPHDAVCSEIFYLLYGYSYVPPKNLSGENPHFSPICRSKVDIFSHTTPYCKEIGKSKTLLSICG